MIYRRTFWVVSCLGALLSSTSLAHAHTRWLVLDSIQADHQAEGDADVTEVADNVMDTQPEATHQLEDEFWSEALKNVEVSSALDTDEDIPTLTAEGSFILPTYILPEADTHKVPERTAVADVTNPWRQDGVTVGEHSVIEVPTVDAPTLDHVEEQYAQTEDLLAQTSTRLESIEARIRELQDLNTQMAQATQEAVDAETERLAATLPAATQVREEETAQEEIVQAEVEGTPSVEVELITAESQPTVVAQTTVPPTPQVKTQSVVKTVKTQTIQTAGQPKPAVQPAVQPEPVLIAEADIQAQQAEIQEQQAAIQTTKAEIKAQQEADQVNAQKNQIQETKDKIAKLQQTVEYAGLQVAYQDTTALLNNTAKKLKGLENDLAQLKKTKENEQKARLIEDQYQKTAELLSITTAQLESVEKRMAALDAQEAQMKAEQNAARTYIVEQTAPAVEPVPTKQVEETLAEETTTLVAESPVVAEQAPGMETPVQVAVAPAPAFAVEEATPIVVAQASAPAVETPTYNQTALPTMQMADATAIQLQNAADALANATARLEALEARLNAAPHETNLAVATPCPKKRPWLLPIEAMEEDTADSDEEATPIIPAVKNTYVDRVLQAIERSEKNRTAATYADDVMLKTIPNEIKINFQPGRAELSAQALKWVRVFSSSVKNRAQNAIEIRMGMQQLELQARRFALLKAALLNSGVSPRQIRFALTNRDNDSVVLRVIPFVQEYDVQERDAQSGEKIKQVIYQW